MAREHWLNSRDGEKIGGGFFVFCRHRESGRVAPGKNELPFEHPTFESAMTEACRLADMRDGKSFCVFEEVGRAEIALESAPSDGVGNYICLDGSEA